MCRMQTSEAPPELASLLTSAPPHAQPLSKPHLHIPYTPLGRTSWPLQGNSIQQPPVYPTMAVPSTPCSPLEQHGPWEPSPRCSPTAFEALLAAAALAQARGFPALAAPAKRSGKARPQQRPLGPAGGVCKPHGCPRGFSRAPALAAAVPTCHAAAARHHHPAPLLPLPKLKSLRVPTRLERPSDSQQRVTWPSLLGQDRRDSW